MNKTKIIHELALEHKIHRQSRPFDYDTLNIINKAIALVEQIDESNEVAALQAELERLRKENERLKKQVEGSHKNQTELVNGATYHLREKDNKIAALKEQLKNAIAIVPKFDVGDEVWCVVRSRFRKDFIGKGKICARKYFDNDIDEKWFEYMISRNINDCDPCEMQEKDIFLTESEAQAALYKMKGEN